jgi:hypothetical protein
LAAKLTRLTHKIAIQLHLVAESCTILSSRSRWPVRKLLDTPLIMTVAWAQFRLFWWRWGLIKVMTGNGQISVALCSAATTLFKSLPGFLGFSRVPPNECWDYTFKWSTVF